MLGVSSDTHLTAQLQIASEKRCRFCGNKKNFKRLKILERVHKPRQYKPNWQRKRKRLQKKIACTEHSESFLYLKLFSLCE